MEDTREFKAGTVVENAERHIGRVVGFPSQGRVKVRWHRGFASIEETDKLRIVESGE
jgi:hypothetical protein